jgi:type IV pilus assembly protein PilE
MKEKCKKNKGFSLTELLVVIVVIGVLILLAMPKFSSVVTRAKETEAKIMLKHLHSLEQAFYYENDIYTADLAALGFEQERLVTEGGKARYKVEVTAADVYGFTAIATAVVDFDKDGIFNIWTINQEGDPVQQVMD